MAKAITLSTDVLDRIWKDWLSGQQLTNYERNFMINRPFGVFRHRCNKSERFEDWLLAQGGTVRRINKKFFIEFTDANKASFFLLRWS